MAYQINHGDLRAFLADGQWRTGVEIFDHFEGSIPPEKAAQAYYKANPGHSDMPEDAAVRLGQALLIRHTLSSCVATGSLEKMGSKIMIGARFRWVAWYCRLCGMIIRSDRPDDCLCGNCSQSISTEGKKDGTADA